LFLVGLFLVVYLNGKAVNLLVILFFLLCFVKAANAGEPSIPNGGEVEYLLDVAYEMETVNPDSAIAIYAQIATLARGRSDAKLEGQTHNYRAIVYFEMGDFENALLHNQYALDLFQKADYEVGIASVKINIGNIRLFTGEFDAAVKLYYDGLAILESLQDTLRLSISYMNIGTLFYRNGYATEAQNYNLKALAWARKLNDGSLLADLHTNTANVHLSLGDEKSYRQYIDSALSYSLGSAYVFGQLMAHNSLAMYFSDLSRVDSALFHSQKAARNARQYGNPANIADVYNALGANYLLADKTDSALIYLHQAVEISQSNNYLQLLATGKLTLSRVYDRLGEHQQAYTLLSDYLVLNDSLFNKDKQRELQELDRRYRVAQKEGEIEQQKLVIELREIELQRKNILVAVAVVFGLVVLILLFVLLQLLRNRTRLAARELEKVKLERERQVMKALLKGEEKERQRIARELHDGVNGNLAALKLNLASCRNKEFDNLLDQTMNEVRALSHNLVPDVVKKFGLEEALQHYISNIRSSSPLAVDYQILSQLPTISDESAVQIYRIVQELVSNTLKHASAMHLLVQLVVNEEFLSITVEDDGRGFEINADGDIFGPGKGIGLIGIENRVTWMQGNIDIHSSTDSGTSVHIEIPLNQIVVS
jgi:two-component system, NarL family, sensor kinase